MNHCNFQRLRPLIFLCFFFEWQIITFRSFCHQNSSVPSKSKLKYLTAFWENNIEVRVPWNSIILLLSLLFLRDSLKNWSYLGICFTHRMRFHALYPPPLLFCPSSTKKLHKLINPQILHMPACKIHCKPLENFWVKTTSGTTLWLLSRISATVWGTALHAEVGKLAWRTWKNGVGGVEGSW